MENKIQNTNDMKRQTRNTSLHFGLIPLLLIVTFTLMPIIDWAQIDSTQREALLVATSFVKDQKVYLRWAPKNYAAWNIANKYGYRVEKLEYKNDDQQLCFVGASMLSKVPFQPMPEAQWEEASLRNDEHAIMAQALYGTNFLAQMYDSHSILDLYNASTENDQRFSFAIMSAELNFETAMLAGLGVVDSTFRPKHAYLYKIYMETPDSLASDTAFVLVNPDVNHRLPLPFEFQLDCSEAQAILKWNAGALSSVYTCYNIYRSIGKKPFEKINSKPFLPFNTDASSGVAIFTDSLRTDEKYRYYVTGINAFGMEGPDAESLSCRKQLNKLPAPIIIGHLQQQEKGIIRWRFPEEVSSAVKQFQLLHAHEVDAPYTSIKTLKSHLREVIFKLDSGSNYYRIKAVGKNNEISYSIPVFMSLPDNTPPGAPKELTGEIDSTGVVQIRWAKNTEPDVKGYLVFKKYHSSHEFQPLTPRAITHNHYTDTISLGMLNPKVFYRVKAVDAHFNESQPSETLMMLKPDTITPAPPAFKSYHSNTGIELKWHPSSSADVITYAIEWLADPEGQWVELIRVKAQEHSYTHTNPEMGNNNYRMIAIDASGLRSVPSQSITLYWGQRGLRTCILHFEASFMEEQQKIHLNWQCTEPDISYFELYRQDQIGHITLLQQLTGEKRKTIDLTAQPFIPYTYLIRAILKNGTQSKAVAAQIL